MADLDLTPVVEAVARARWGRGTSRHLTWEEGARRSPYVADAIRRAALGDVLAAVPLIREQIAQQIEQTEQASKASLVDRPKVGTGQFLNDWQWAALIARGGAS